MINYSVWILLVRSAPKSAPTSSSLVFRLFICLRTVNAAASYFCNFVLLYLEQKHLFVCIALLISGHYTKTFHVCCLYPCLTNRVSILFIAVGTAIIFFIKFIIIIIIIIIYLFEAVRERSANYQCKLVFYGSTENRQ
jgi:hypothetical protein